MCVRVLVFVCAHVCARVRLTSNLLPISHADSERLNYNGTSNVINLPIHCNFLYLPRGSYVRGARFMYLHDFKYVINTFFSGCKKRLSTCTGRYVYVFGQTRTIVLRCYTRYRTTHREQKSLFNSTCTDVWAKHTRGPPVQRYSSSTS
jgi:hypothetical protein